MKLLFDFLPIALFFAVFKYAESHREAAAAFATSQLGFMVSGGTVGPTEAPVLLATVVGAWHEAEARRDTAGHVARLIALRHSKPSLNRLRR